MNKLPILALALLAFSARADLQTLEQAPAAGWSFRNHVQPVLTKAGCNSGACHGAAAGKNGFKLSLRGYDDRGDFLALTRHAWGRRVTPSAPSSSLILRKATTTVPHKGDKRFEVGSLEYKVLTEWIAAGANGPKDGEARIERIEIQPAQVTLKPNESAKLQVRARFADGREEDVTRWVKYTSTQQGVAVVDEVGGVKVLGPGEGVISAWYLSKIATARITVPYENPTEGLAEGKGRNFIDDEVLKKLRELRLPPSPLADDAGFLRRAFLDATGTLPKPEETRDFLADASSDKRDKLIEALLQRSEFVDFWAYKWSDLLLVQSERLKPAAMWSYYRWVRDQVAANTPWDALAKKLLLAQGSTLENGAANFFVLHQDPKLLAETTTQTFLGMSMNCAQCHNHPMEKWTNNDYYAFANLFSRVRAKNGADDSEKVIFTSAQGDLAQPLTGKPQAARPLDSPAVGETTDRRLPLAEWLTSPKNPMFARSVVNRVWANFFGIGLVMSVDDMRATNPASNEELLNKLAAFLVEQKYDLKALMRAIMQSETYQRSSEPLPGNAADTRFHARYYPRRLMAEVMLDAMSAATGAPTNFPGYPPGWRALQLPDSKVASYFLKSFGRPERNLTCECERTAEPSVTQVLHLANGGTLNEKLSAKGNRIEQLLSSNVSPEKIVEEAYTAALSRRATAKEMAAHVAVITEAKPEERRQAVEDVFWALLSSKEFLFNH